MAGYLYANGEYVRTVPAVTPVLDHASLRIKYRSQAAIYLK
jgi:hypothetical protein